MMRPLVFGWWPLRAHILRWIMNWSMIIWIYWSVLLKDIFCQVFKWFSFCGNWLLSFVWIIVIARLHLHTSWCIWYSVLDITILFIWLKSWLDKVGNLVERTYPYPWTISGNVSMMFVKEFDQISKPGTVSFIRSPALHHGLVKFFVTVTWFLKSIALF